jgi:hypothetical protein
MKQKRGSDFRGILRHNLPGRQQLEVEGTVRPGGTTARSDENGEKAMGRFLICTLGALLLNAGWLGPAEAGSRSMTRSPLVHALVRGQLRTIDNKHGSLELLTVDGLQHFDCANIKVITPGGQVYSVKECPYELIRPGRAVKVLMTRSGNAVSGIIVDLRQGH